VLLKPAPVAGPADEVRPAGRLHRAEGMPAAPGTATVLGRHVHLSAAEGRRAERAGWRRAWRFPGPKMATASQNILFIESSFGHCGRCSEHRSPRVHKRVPKVTAPRAGRPVAPPARRATVVSRPPAGGIIGAIALPSDRCTLVLYDELLHDHNEPEQAKVLTDVITWLDRQTALR
jgi:hypothetical protein